MYSQTTTPEQKIIFRPYSQKFVFYKDAFNKMTYYIDSDLNKFTNIFGENCILEGCDLLSFNYTLNSANFTISKGRVIINSTYFKYNSNVSVEFKNLNMFDPNAILVLSLYFNNTNVVRKNIPELQITYFSAANNIYTTTQQNFQNSLKNRIILNIFNFTKVQQTSTVSSLNNITSNFTNNIITLNNIQFPIRPTYSNLDIIYDYGEL